MARALKFKYSDAEFECELHKVDRSKLYGTVDIETRDNEGNRCGLAAIANDGKTLIPYGGTAFAYINAEGEWVERNELSPANMEGEKLPTIPSSFDLTIELNREVSDEEYLNHSARLCYQLGTGDSFSQVLRDKLLEGAVFKFDFLYREGVSADPAFILATPDNIIWMMVGEPSSIDYVGLDQAAVSFAVSEDDTDEGSEEFDFEML